MFGLNGEVQTSVWVNLANSSDERLPNRYILSNLPDRDLRSVKSGLILDSNLG